MTATLSSARVSELAAIGKARNPQLSARIDRAAQIVLAGEYQASSDPDTLIVRGYHVNGACECPDYRLGNAPIVNGTHYCKHKIAKAFVSRLSKLAECEKPNVWAQSMAWQSFARSYSK